MFPIKIVYSVGMGMASFLIAQGEQVLHADPAWTAIGNFGLAVVIAGGSFSLLAWWFRKNVQDQRADTERMAQRIIDLEDKLVEAILKTSESTIAMAQTMRENTIAIQEMAREVKELNDRMSGRACLAIEALTQEKRQQVYNLLQ